MPAKSSRKATLDFKEAARLLQTLWEEISAQGAANPDLAYLSDENLRANIRKSIHHKWVSYRFCLPIQLLGKVMKPALDCLRLQKRKGDAQDLSGWDARSLGSNVVAPFNQSQENILGTSLDPYVGNPMRIPKMLRDDPTKKDVAGWNALVGVLEQVESRNDPAFTDSVFRQVLLEMLRRQQALRFSYPVPPRVSLQQTLAMSSAFLEEKSGGDRMLALAGALFDTIGAHFGLFAQVNRARINATDEATGQAADLECLSPEGKLVMAVEVKDRVLTLADVEGTLQKSRHRQITEILFTAPGIREAEESSVEERVSRAFTSGQNLYVFDFLELARSVLAIGGEAIRKTYLRKVGEHLDTWNTQPAHRQAWQKLLLKL